MGRWTRWAMLAALLLGGTAPAGAQLRTGPDTAALPADTVRLAVSRAAGLDGCRVPDEWVVDDSASAGAVRAFPQCRGADFGDLAERTVVGVPLLGDCHAGFGVDVWRSERLREYRVRVRAYDGGCRSARVHFRWLVLPKLPAGWGVRITRTRIERGEWTRGLCAAADSARQRADGPDCWW